MLTLLLAALLFVGIHLLVAGTPLRNVFVSHLGEKIYLVLFSLTSLLVLIGEIWSYRQAPYVELWGQIYAWRWVAWVLMLPALWLGVLGLITPNPTAVGGESLLRREEPAQGIFRLTRHPFLVGASLWALVHLVYNGDLASLIFFSSFLVVSIVGPSSIDRKQRDALGKDWIHFAHKTSILPFAAILQGRNQFRLREFDWWRTIIALVVYISLLHSHAWLFGVSPLVS